MNRSPFAMVLLTALILLLSACAQMNEPVRFASPAKAESGAPEAAQVEPVSIPADPDRPTAFVTVEPFQVAAQDVRSGGGAVPLAPNRSFHYGQYYNEQSVDRPETQSPSPPLDPRLGAGLSAKLLTALGNVGNVAVIDYDSYLASPGKYPGIIVIKGTITEFSETSEAADQKKGFSTLPAGIVVGDIGRAVGSRALSAAGRIVTHSDVSKQDTATIRKGMVGIDIRLVEASGRVLGSFPCQGTFQTQSATKHASVLGYTASSAAYQASALSQAERAALNDAAAKIHNCLKQKAPR